MKNITRYIPSWDEYFIGLAFSVSVRSKDARTQHGAVIVNDKNKVIGLGYNGAIAGIDDRFIPIHPPEKYVYFIHAEINALLNCVKLSDEKCRIYITGQPCNDCFQKLIQAGIKEFIIAKRQGTQLENEETFKIFNKIKKLTKVKVKYININLDWIIKFLENIQNKLK